MGLRILFEALICISISHTYFFALYEESLQLQSLGQGIAPVTGLKFLRISVDMIQEFEGLGRGGG